jgi:hypothetical protein
MSFISFHKHPVGTIFHTAALHVLLVVHFALVAGSGDPHCVFRMLSTGRTVTVDSSYAKRIEVTTGKIKLESF